MEKIVSVVIVSYNRCRELYYALKSLSEQTRLPDEVLIVLKRSIDNSEMIVREFSNRLKVNLIIQEEGNVTDAIQIAINNSKGELLLFLDDDAIAHKEWVERYIALFEKEIDAAGIQGITFKSTNAEPPRLSDEIFYTPKPTHGAHRVPMKIYSGYSTWVSTSGLHGVKEATEPITRSALLMGVNMGWLKKAIEGVPLSILYRGSKKGIMFEQLLVHYSRLRGYHSYNIIDYLISPIVWHLNKADSLSRGSGFRNEFWTQFDNAMMFWRLKCLGGNFSFPRYIFGLGVYVRYHFIPRFLGSMTGFFYGIWIFIEYKLNRF